MTAANTRTIHLSYGHTATATPEVSGDRVLYELQPPRPHAGIATALDQALEHPVDFPPLKQALVPGDRVCLAVAADTPQAPAVIAGICRVLAAGEVRPADVTLLVAEMDESGGAGLLAELPDDFREHVRVRTHDPADERVCGYLASSVSGERIYLARDLLTADVVISVGSIGYDALMGYRGTSSVFYPGLSSDDAAQRAIGQGHRELRPEDVRPLRQLVDEIGWLLGTQFTVQVLPAAGDGVWQVIAGLNESVQRRGNELLDEKWRIRLESRADIVVAAIDAGAGGHRWEDVAAALSTARDLVARGGKIVLLTELDEPPGEGLQILRQCLDSREAIRPLRERAPDDLLIATRLAEAVDWADVYLLSRLDSDLVEDLFLTPLESTAEVERLLSGEGTCVFINSAQHTFGQVLDYDE